MFSRDDAWSAIEAAFDEALSLPSAEHAAFLDRLDPSLRAEVAALLANHHSEDAAFEHVVGAVAGAWQDATTNEVTTTLVGRRIGAYTITAIAGQGGMGAVYRARRDDGQFEQDVAIKLVRHGYESAAAVERFRQERQILARLTHPGVARLLDGGAALDEAGRDVPYLVMEFVEGRSITSYCRDGALTIRQRLDLFQQVCAAVQHAHQQLIVHRDLKPANILVNGDGHVKLLDFGIAKLIAEDMPQMTRVGAALLTPAYASPEQVTGAPITVATDVYALGLILYEILTGQQAQQVTSDSALELTRVVCDTVATRPSQAVRTTQPAAASFARQLDGDIDTIVLKAIQKDPARRYTSVEQFAGDIRRHLDGRPVLARPDTRTYRTRKFIQRHRLAVAAAVTIVIAIAVGVGATMRQARIANERFEQVRKLANTFLFQVHDQIAPLAGSTKARELLVTTALEYLDQLSQSSGNDAALDLELAEAYNRVGDVQGGARSNNLGQFQQAVRSYEKALTIGDRLRASGSASPAVLSAVANAHYKLAEMSDLPSGLDLEAAERHLTAAGQLVPEIVRGNDKRPWSFEILVLRRLSEVKADLGQLDPAVTYGRQAQGRAREWFAAEPGVSSRYAIVGADFALGDALKSDGQLSEALSTFRDALRHVDMLATASPNDADFQRDLALIHGRLGSIGSTLLTLGVGNGRETVQHHEAELHAQERLLAADPSNVRARVDVFVALRELATAQARMGDPRARATIDRAHRLARDIPASAHDLLYLRNAAELERADGLAWQQAGDMTKALLAYRSAVSATERMLETRPNNVTLTASWAGYLSELAEAEAAHGATTVADDIINRATGTLDALRRSQPDSGALKSALADLYESRGKIAARTDAGKARQAFEQCRALSVDAGDHEFGELRIAQIDRLIAGLNRR